MRAAILAAAAMLAACASAQPTPAPRAAAPAAAAPASPIAVRNPGFEESDPHRRCAPGWDCTMHADPESFRVFADTASPRQGERSFCVERVRPEPWALVRQLVRHEQLRGATLRLSMDVRVEGASGPGAGPWVLVEGRSVVNEMKLTKGSAGWARSHVDFAIPPEATGLVIGATLEGPGKACFDDVRLEVR